MLATKKRVRKIISTQAERRLAEVIKFQGKYVDSLLEAAAQKHKIEDASAFQTAASYLREIDRKLEESVHAKWGISLRQYRKLLMKAEQILRDFSTGYSMGENKRLMVGEHLFCAIDNTREYARSSKFRAAHGDLKINLTLSQLRKIERIEGVWTVRGKDSNASWLQSFGAKHRHEMKWVKGYLVGTSHGLTRSDCEALEEGKAIRTDAGEVKRLDRFVGLRHRAKAGACEAGVLAFCERNNLDPQLGYRIDYLLGLGDPVATSYLHRLASRF